MNFGSHPVLAINQKNVWQNVFIHAKTVLGGALNIAPLSHPQMGFVICHHSEFIY
jgi:hypothetical protein